jgi:predicted transcriptional regulator
MGKYKETPRYNVISMRVSDLERKELQHIASRHALSMSDMMRQAIDIFTRYHEPTGSQLNNF